jgi:hypothetical protein
MHIINTQKTIRIDKFTNLLIGENKVIALTNLAKYRGSRSGKEERQTYSSNQLIIISKIASSYRA